MNKRELGADYEDVAIAYLKALGYEILCKNFRCRTGEIDIIGKKEGYYRFIEVKYRTNGLNGLPEEAVGFHKQKSICKVALYYLLKNQLGEDAPCCFDVVSILNDEIKLYENAFDFC